METWTHEQVAAALSGKITMTCGAIHSGPCLVYWLREAIKLFLTSLKFYVPLNLIPALIRYKKLIAKPKETLLATTKATLRSTLMLAMMSFLGKISMCSILKFYGSDKTLMMVTSLVSVQASWIESTSKLSELSLFLMPRFFTTFWNFLKRRSLAKDVPGGLELIFCLTMAIFMYSCKYEPEHVKPMYKTLHEKFFGKAN